MEGYRISELGETEKNTAETYQLCSVLAILTFELWKLLLLFGSEDVSELLGSVGSLRC